MLFHHNTDQIIYVIGNGVLARQIHALISKDHPYTQLVNPDQVETIADNSQCFLGFMNCDYRLAMLSRTVEKKFTWPTYLHPAAFIDDHTDIGRGVVVLDHVHVGFESKISNWCYLDSKVTLAHNSKMGINCVFTIGTTVGGSTVIGNNVVAGLNTTFCNKISVCDGARFAMCSIVSHDILLPGDYYGTKKINKLKL